MEYFSPFIFFFAAIFVGAIIYAIGYDYQVNKQKKEHDTYLKSNYVNMGNGYYVDFGDKRYINGHALRDRDDYIRWSVLLGFSKGLERHVRELERACTDVYEMDGEQKYHEWEQAYEKYRDFCRNKQFWNAFVGDRTIFIPTASQEYAENRYKDSIKRKYEDSVPARNANVEHHNTLKEKQKMILDYINASPKKRAVRREMLREIAIQGNRPLVQKAYDDLLQREVIGEKKVDSKYMVRIIHHRKKKDPNDLPASQYNPALYSNVDKRMIYKVEYTVAHPQNVDREKNTCQFVSMTSGETYFTSLEKCTCPVYDPKSPCKHMVALAIYLGYFNRSNAKG